MNNEGKIILSILIPSIPEREQKLKNLIAELNKQILLINPWLGIVELVVDDSKSFLQGGRSIGRKRTSLLRKSKGKYLCFLDDDESISPNYIESLLRLCDLDMDVCTFQAFVKLETYWALVNMKLLYKVNDQLSPEYTIRRPPWHMCPVKSEYAKLYEFPDINNAEDFVWMEKVLTHCRTEAHTDKILFQYNHGKHSEADKIEKYELTK